uniref:(northern house mosquito) hypothetical protein n=1 Tax=Culex pipiens TaxID=7175 RepID=A0A8D8NTY7_CULPI
MKRRRRHWTWEDGVQGVTILETLSNETQHAHTSVRGTGKHRIEVGETIKCIWQSNMGRGGNAGFGFFFTTNYEKINLCLPCESMNHLCINFIIHYDEAF